MVLRPDARAAGGPVLLGFQTLLQQLHDGRHLLCPRMKAPTSTETTPGLQAFTSHDQNQPVLFQVSTEEPETCRMLMT